MEITDLAGNKITVTDLRLAIMQADDFRHYRVENPSAHHEYLTAYWEDMYQKLIRLNDVSPTDS